MSRILRFQRVVKVACANDPRFTPGQAEQIADDEIREGLERWLPGQGFELEEVEKPEKKALCLTDRQTATVLVALRSLLNSTKRPERELADWPQFKLGGLKPLTRTEIRSLCEKLNLE